MSFALFPRRCSRDIRTTAALPCFPEGYAGASAAASAHRRGCAGAQAGTLPGPQCFAVLAVTQDIQAAVVRGRKQVSAHIGDGFSLSQLLEALEEHVLKDVLCRGSVAEESGAIQVHALPVASVQLTECRRFSIADLEDEGLVVCSEFIHRGRHCSSACVEVHRAMW